MSNFITMTLFLDTLMAIFLLQVHMCSHDWYLQKNNKIAICQLQIILYRSQQHFFNFFVDYKLFFTDHNSIFQKKLPCHHTSIFSHSFSKLPCDLFLVQFIYILPCFNEIFLRQVHMCSHGKFAMICSLQENIFFYKLSCVHYGIFLQLPLSLQQFFLILPCHHASNFCHIFLNVYNVTFFCTIKYTCMENLSCFIM